MRHLTLFLSAYSRRREEERIPGYWVGKDGYRVLVCSVRVDGYKRHREVTSNSGKFSIITE